MWIFAVNIHIQHMLRHACLLIIIGNENHLKTCLNPNSLIFHDRRWYTWDTRVPLVLQNNYSRTLMANFRWSWESIQWIVHKLKNTKNKETTKAMWDVKFDGILFYFILNLNNLDINTHDNVKWLKNQYGIVLLLLLKFWKQVTKKYTRQ